QFTGRTGTNKIVNFSSNNVTLGRLVKVSIKCAFKNSLQGVLV
ncbi:TRAM domain-containing protein, partial [Thermodesulfobacteriota bacterium]